MITRNQLTLKYVNVTPRHFVTLLFVIIIIFRDFIITLNYLKSIKLITYIYKFKKANKFILKIDLLLLK